MAVLKTATLWTINCESEGSKEVFRGIWTCHSLPVIAVAFPHSRPVLSAARASWEDTSTQVLLKNIHGIVSVEIVRCQKRSHMKVVCKTPTEMATGVSLIEISLIPEPAVKALVTWGQNGVLEKKT